MSDKVHGQEPINREPEISKLTSTFITEDGYERNHCAQPAEEQLNARTHRVLIDGCVHNSLNLSITSLRSDFPQHEVVCALQCAGNRRHDMRTVVREVQGIDVRIRSSLPPFPPASEVRILFYECSASGLSFMSWIPYPKF